MKPLTIQEAAERGYFIYSYHNGDYSYKIDETHHLIRDGKEIAEGSSVCSYYNGDYEYTENGVTHEFDKDGKEIYYNNANERQAGRNEMREALSSALNGQLTQKQVNILLSR